VISVEVDNRSGVAVDEGAAVEHAGAVLRAEGVDDGELGLAFVGPDEISALKRDHLGIDEPTDVLSFPIDGRDPLPGGMPRALGDVVLCPQIVGDDWRGPLTHGLLHLLGYDHGEAMEARERELSGGFPRSTAAASTEAKPAEVPGSPAPEQHA
jgi:probable rRNA maturation factor